MNRPLRLAECFVGISWVFVALLIIRLQRNGSPSAAVGADLSCPRIRIRHAFANCLKCIHGVFATCSLSVCYIIAIQKYGFCNAKVWFLACKKGVFALQKYGFCNSKVWFFFSLHNSVHNQ
ncbi:hypothetical protein [Prevotella pallens]